MRYSQLYKTFAYLFLGRVEHVLDAQQPEEQHCFRAGRRFEEHLLSANILLDKAEATGFPVWIISLDLSKAFDRARWPALWTALFEQGDPQHLIWILQRVYHGQHGRSEGPITYHRRSATRLRSQSTVILCRLGICYAKMTQRT